MRLRAAMLDMDGTIFDARVDFLPVREEFGLPRDGRGILEQILDLAPAQRDRGLQALVAVEEQGAACGDLMPGAVELVDTLRECGVLTALITNNSRASVETFLARFPLGFDLTLSRDDGPTKPSPFLMREALARFRVASDQAVALGDAHLDLLAAQAAGIPEIVLVNPAPWILEFVPKDLRYRPAANLRDALAQIRALL
ncbi:MAG: HAD-IA family hydrolase [Candidatus Bipolaricaulota bacterium]